MAAKQAEEFLSTKQLLRKVAEEAGIAIPQTQSASSGDSQNLESPTMRPALVRAERSPAPYRSICPYCRELLEGADSEREHMALERSPERATPRILSGLIDNGIMQEHVDAKLEDFDKPVQRTARVLIGDVAYRGLLATGAPGTGKTRLMVAICREYLLQGRRIEYTHARAFFRRLWNTYRDNAEESEQAVLESFGMADLLAIDDLGHEGKVSEAVVGALHEVISHRHGNYKATVITTNLSIDEIGRKYDESIASRLQAWLPVVLAGKDRRAK